MKRLSLTILCAAAFFAFGFTVYFQITSSHSNNISRVEAAHGDNVPDSATVSFGGWMTSPVVDRFPNNSPRLANHHALAPKTVTIKAGGMVNFIIGGFHQVIVYDRAILSNTALTDRTSPFNSSFETFGINPNLLITPTAGGPPLINDPNGRVYNGLDPSLQPRDRVEVVQFDKPGLYFVICGVLPHFQEGMYGFVRVVPNNNDSNH